MFFHSVIVHLSLKLEALSGCYEYHPSPHNPSMAILCHQTGS
jgi:hypothetical protein